MLALPRSPRNNVRPNAVHCVPPAAQARGNAPIAWLPAVPLHAQSTTAWWHKCGQQRRADSGACQNGPIITQCAIQVLDAWTLQPPSVFLRHHGKDCIDLSAVSHLDSQLPGASIRHRAKTSPGSHRSVQSTRRARLPWGSLRDEPLQDCCERLADGVLDLALAHRSDMPQRLHPHQELSGFSHLQHVLPA